MVWAVGAVEAVWVMWVVGAVWVVGAAWVVWVVWAAGMHWRPLNTLITKELQASGGMGGESGGVVRAAWGVRMKRGRLHLTAQMYICSSRWKRAMSAAIPRHVKFARCCQRASPVDVTLPTLAETEVLQTKS